MNILQPITNVKLINVNKIKPNDYNPNKVDNDKMKLLYTSIEKSGWTLPIVVMETKKDNYQIIDGFHRYKISKKFKLKEVPCVIIQGDEKQMISATMRHNLARGNHSIIKESEIIKTLAELGWTVPEIVENIGFDVEIIKRIVSNEGIAHYFKDFDWSECE